MSSSIGRPITDVLSVTTFRTSVRELSPLGYIRSEPGRRLGRKLSCLGPTRIARKLSEVPYYLQDFTVNHDVSPDGQGFLMIQWKGRSGTTRELHIVLNWCEELKVKVPSGAEH